MLKTKHFPFSLFYHAYFYTLFSIYAILFSFACPFLLNIDFLNCFQFMYFHLLRISLALYFTILINDLYNFFNDRKVRRKFWCLTNNTEHKSTVRWEFMTVITILEWFNTFRSLGSAATDRSWTNDDYIPVQYSK